MRSRKGFTLMELMIVVIILGILAGVALPQMFTAIEKARSVEGLAVLQALGASEVRYYVENNKFTATKTDLDIEYSAATKFFNIVPLAPGASGKVGTATRNATSATLGAYVLSICSNGRVFCTDGTAGSCLKISQGASATACP